jgi:hypothetical protein
MNRKQRREMMPKMQNGDLSLAVVHTISQPVFYSTARYLRG